MVRTARVALVGLAVGVVIGALVAAGTVAAISSCRHRPKRSVSLLRRFMARTG